MLGREKRRPTRWGQPSSPAALPTPLVTAASDSTWGPAGIPGLTSYRPSHLPQAPQRTVLWTPHCESLRTRELKAAGPWHVLGLGEGFLTHMAELKLPGLRWPAGTAGGGASVLASRTSRRSPCPPPPEDLVDPRRRLTTSPLPGRGRGG